MKIWMRILALSLFTAFILAVQRDTFVRRGLLPSRHTHESTAILTVRLYDISHLLPNGSSDTSRTQESRAIIPMLEHGLSSSSAMCPLHKLLIMIAEPVDQVRMATMIEQTRTLKPGEHGPLVPLNAERAIPAQSNDTTPGHDAGSSDVLTRKVEHLELSPMSRSDLFQCVGRASGVEIRLSPGIPALQRNQIDPPTTIDDVDLEQAIEVLCRPREGQVPLFFDVVDGIVHVMTEQELIDARLIRVYDIRDIGNKNWIRFWRWRVGGAASNDDDGIVDDPLLAVHAILTAFVASEGWIMNGGRFGEAMEVEGRLVVTQTRENHRRVQAFLAEVRGGRYSLLKNP